MSLATTVDVRSPAIEDFLTSSQHIFAGPFVIATTALLLGCGDSPTEPTLEQNPDIRPFVVDSAASALDSDGRFRIDPDVVQGPENIAIVLASRARELAAAFTHSYGPAFLPFWEQDRRGSIDLAALSVSTRVYPAQTAFGAIPQVGCHPAFERLFGSFYLLTLDRGSEWQVRMAVSAQTTEFSVDANDDLVEPSRTGQDFIHEGIPVRGEYVVSPEQAVALAARATGAKVRRVPRVVLQRNNEYSPTFALWRLELDRSAVVDRVNGQRMITTTLYVGPNARFFVPKQAQPTSVTQICSKVDENLVDGGLDTIVVPVMNAKPVDFEAVVPLRP